MSKNWSPDDVQVAKELFLASRSAARRGPTALLWQYWSATCPGDSLFGDPEQDLALVVHARAYGLTDVGEDDQRFGDLFRQGQAEYAPLTPAAPPFGARTNLSLAMHAVLDSPIMDAWVYEENSAPTGVLIFGTGLPQVRERVVADAFMTSVQLGTIDTDIVGTGIIRVDAASAAQRALQLPLMVLGRADALAASSSSTAADVLEGFVARLRKLASSTGLIRFHVADFAARSRVATAIEDRASQASGERPMVWAPGAGDDLPEEVPVLMPVLSLPRGRTLELPLSADLLNEPAYQALAQEYQGATLDRMVDDAKDRHAYHEAEKKRLRDDHEAYKATPERDRLTMWGAKVALTHFFDFDTLRAIRLPFPEDIDAKLFYLNHVPAQADRHEQAALSMQRILDDVRAATDSPEAPIPRLIAGSLLDAAMRGRRPVGTDSFVKSFDAWAERVRPMLCFEWRRALRVMGIDPGHVFTSHSAVHTYFAQDGETLLQVPFTVVDQRYSAALFDPDHRVVVIRDPSDSAAQAPAVSRQEADERWAQLISLAERRDVAFADFEANFMASVREAPVETITRSLEVLSGLGEGPAAAAEAADIEGRVAAARARLAVSYGMRRTWAALSLTALHTAYMQLTELRDTPGRLGAQVALTEATAVFLASPFASDRAAVYRCFSRPRSSGLNPRFDAAVRRAQLCDRAYTDEWIGLLDERKNLDLGRVIGRLLLDLPTSETLLERQQRAVLLARSGAEAVRLARQLERAAEELSGSGESFAAAFAKLGLQMEDVLLANFAAGPPAGAIGLLQVLTGQARGVRE